MRKKAELAAKVQRLQERHSALAAALDAREASQQVWWGEAIAAMLSCFRVIFGSFEPCGGVGFFARARQVVVPLTSFFNPPLHGPRSCM